MLMPRVDFTAGQQPCQDYNPKPDGNGYGTWANEHSCIYCDSTVSFCLSCHSDHHADGYESCTRKYEADVNRRLAEIAREREERRVALEKAKREGAA